MPIFQGAIITIFSEIKYMRPSKRNFNQMRQVSIEKNYLKNNPASCLIRVGNTEVICAASIDQNLPKFLKNKGQGWVTAEYGMLPSATATRTTREAAHGKQGGRTIEIQRLIGRSLRSVVDFKALGERQIIIDCDVINADGGTRCAAITGGYVALHLACQQLIDAARISRFPLKSNVAAVSAGIFQGQPILDLEYLEDKDAGTDANFVMTGSGKIIEIQGTAEAEPFTEAEFLELLGLAKSGIAELVAMQNEVLG